MGPDEHRSILADELVRGAAMALDGAEHEKAIARLKQALLLDPRNVAALSRLGWAKYQLLDCTAAGMDAAMPSLNQALALAPHDPLANQYAGIILATHTADTASAMDMLETAADEPDQMEMLALDLLYTRLTISDPGRLERLLRRMIALVDRQSPEGSYLWDKLALLYDNVLGDRHNAEIARRMAGHHDEPHQAPSAITLWLAQPEDDELSQRLWMWACDQNDTDLRYRVGMALYTAGSDAVREKAQIAVYPASLTRAVTVVDASMWNSIRDSDDLLVLDAMAELVGPYVPGYMIHEMGLDQFMEVTIKDQPDAFAECLHYVASMLSIPVPKVFVLPDLDYEVCIGASRDPILLVGDQVLRYPQPVPITYLVAKALSFSSPGRILAATRPGDTLVSLFAGTHPHCINMSAAEKNRLERLRSRLPRLDNFALQQWREGLARTAERVAITLCADLRPLGDTWLLDHNKRHNLLEFWLSPGHGEIRKQLGLSRNIGFA